MALQISVFKFGVNETYTKIEIQDNTGDYNADTNPGGYGTPNPDRADLTLWLENAVNKRLDDGDVDVTVDSYNPETVSDWFVNRNKDGWYQMDAYALQDFDSVGNSYPNNDQFGTNELVYDPSTGNFYEITGVTGAGPYSYTNTELTGATTVTEAIALGTANIAPISEFELNTYDISELQIMLYKALIKYEETKDDDDWRTYYTMDAFIKLITYMFENGNYTVAQDLVEKLEQYEDCLEGVTCNLPTA